MPINETIAALEETIKRPLTNVERLIAENAWQDATIESLRAERDRVECQRVAIRRIADKVGVANG